MTTRRRKAKIANSLVGIAGVHYVAYELSRRNIVVLPTTRNTAGYDIVAVSANGKRNRNIQVKAAQKRPSFWPMPSSSNIPHGPNDCFVLVRGIGRGPVDCFLVEGKEARRRTASARARRVSTRHAAVGSPITPVAPDQTAEITPAFSG